MSQSPNLRFSSKFGEKPQRVIRFWGKRKISPNILGFFSISPKFSITVSPKFTLNGQNFPQNEAIRFRCSLEYKKTYLKVRSLFSRCTTHNPLFRFVCWGQKAYGLCYSFATMLLCVSDLLLYEAIEKEDITASCSRFKNWLLSVKTCMPRVFCSFLVLVLQR